LFFSSFFENKNLIYSIHFFEKLEEEIHFATCCEDHLGGRVFTINAQNDIIKS